MSWIDLQVNGYGGVNFNAPGLTPEMVLEITRRLAADGTTGFMPTLVTMDPDMLIPNIRAVVAARKRYADCEGAILGFFLEGPFISPEPGAVGAHDVAWVRRPDWDLFGRFQEAAEGLVRMGNIAAELPGATEFIRRAVDSGVKVSLGHQMAHEPAVLDAAIRAGASAFTHLGNGIPNLIHRRENVIWEALADDRATVMFIPDGRHLTIPMLKVYTRGVPLRRLIAVSDAQFVAGLPPGDYEVGGIHARLEPDGLLWNPERNCLVGATSPIAKMVALLQEKVGLTPDECRAIAHDNPLRFLGL
jgi:N-acetylglucosamine-6-phosphate deacetylase